MAGAGIAFAIDGNTLLLVYDDNEDRPIGTAFCFIRPDWIVTAKHVVLEMGLPRPSLSIRSFVGEPVRALPLFLHPSHDLAVLHLEGQSPCQVPLFPGFEEFTGQKGLVCCGYSPSLSDKQKPSYTMLVNYILSYEREEPRIRDTGDEATILFDAPFLEGGHSGGPIFGDGGAVVAVIIDRLQDESGNVRGRATSILHLLNYLRFRSASAIPPGQRRRPHRRADTEPHPRAAER